MKVSLENSNQTNLAQNSKRLFDPAKIKITLILDSRCFNINLFYGNYKNNVLVLVDGWWCLKVVEGI